LLAGLVVVLQLTNAILPGKIMFEEGHYIADIVAKHTAAIVATHF